jgi:xylose isomerase
MTTPYIGAKEYFPGIGRIPFEGRDSDNPLAFKVYDANKKIGGKTMAEHLKFAVCYWHTFTNAGHDPFGPGTRKFPWEGATPMQTAENKVDAAFEFITKLGVPYYCFHDVDLAPGRGGHRPVREEPQAHGRARQGAPERHRRQAAVGHGEPVLASALH